MGAGPSRTPSTQSASNDSQPTETEVENAAAEGAKSSPRTSVCTVDEIAQAQRDAVHREAEAKRLKDANDSRLQDIKKREAEYMKFDEWLGRGEVGENFWTDWAQNVIKLVNARGYTSQHLNKMDLNPRQASGALGLGLHIFEAAVARNADRVAELMSRNLVGHLVTAEFKCEIRQILKDYIGRNATRNSRLGSCLLGPYLVMDSSIHWTRSLKHLPLVVHLNETCRDEPRESGTVVPQNLTPHEEGTTAVNEAEKVLAFIANKEVQDCAKKAYLAMKYAERATRNAEITVKEAYDYLKSHSICLEDNNDSEVAKLLQDYKPPVSFETFETYVSKARKAIGNPRNRPRAGRPTGGSVCMQDEL
jgi:hypothetical protein